MTCFEALKGIQFNITLLSKKKSKRQLNFLRSAFHIKVQKIAVWFFKMQCEVFDIKSSLDIFESTLTSFNCSSPTDSALFYFHFYIISKYPSLFMKLHEAVFSKY